ncbi:XylR family transcriptional regulator [Pelomonas sp. HMWF004]|nr:XylR family transcriptional regulator [Pelomonas sp. HMWF004]
MHRAPDLNAVAARFLRSAQGPVASPSERLILDLVRKAGVIARADLTRACGLSGPGAKGLIDELVGRGMLALGAPASKGRGQPSATVALVPSYACCVGLSVMVDGFSVTLMDFAGGLLGHRAVRSFPLKLEKVASRAKAAIENLLLASEMQADAIFGIGLSMTGPFVGTGSQVNPPLSMPDDWASTELDRYFSEQLGHPVWMDNDANCAATAEAQYGIGRTVSNFVYLHFTDGFGSGVVQDGRLLRGNHGNAGEVGRLFALSGLPRPNLQTLRERLQAAGHDLPDLQSMLLHYDPAWPEIDAWLADVRSGMTMVVAAITALLDPEAIVLGERLPQDLAERLRACVEFETQPRRGLGAPGPRLVLSEIGANATGIGAAALPLKEHFFL